MSKCLFRLALVVCTVMVGLVFLPPPAAAQNPSYFTYVSWWAVPRSQWAAFEKQEKADDATMQKLVADGTIVDWGDTETIVHTEDGYTHAEWFSATSRANLLKALETLWAGATNPAFVAATKHRDAFLHTLAHGGKTISDATGYIRVSSYQSRPGEGDALEGYVLKILKPMLDNDVANGTLLMYNFDTEDIHTDAPGTYDLALVFPNGEAIDRFFADLATAEKENPTLGQVFDSLTVEKAHRDSLARVTAYEHK